MPKDHQKYLEWDGDRFRKWDDKIGPHTSIAVSAILASKRVEQQSFKSCMALLKLTDKYSDIVLEKACEKALSLTPTPSYKSIKNILVTNHKDDSKSIATTRTTQNQFGITRGASYYGGKNND